MAIDINNLSKELKEGKIIGEGTRAVLLTPVARASFPSLVEEEKYRGKPTGKFAITPLFETDPGQSAAVDLKVNFLPFFTGILQKYGIKAQIVDGNLMAGTQTLLHKGEKRSKEDKPYAGYGPGTVWLKANHRINAQNPAVVCYNAAGEEIDPAAIYGGCYIRLKVGLYKPKDYPNLSITLKSVQFITDGERFAGDGLAVMDAIEGAEPTPQVVDTPDNVDLSGFLL